jgi:hypothetical protein
MVNKYNTLSKRIERIKEQEKSLREKKELLEKKRQKVCLHLHIEKSGGDKWFNYPEWGTNPFRMQCKDCGLLGIYTHRPEEEKWLKNWNILEKGR